jgi:hypothetical protein
VSRRDVAAAPLVRRCAKCGRVSGYATFASDRGLCHRCEGDHLTEQEVERV